MSKSASVATPSPPIWSHSTIGLALVEGIIRIGAECLVREPSYRRNAYLTKNGYMNIPLSRELS